MLTIAEMLRQKGVVGRFVEFYGAGVGGLPLADRATIGNMSPEFGSTVAIFPIDAETLRYLRSPGARPSRSSWSRPTPRSRACGTTRARREPLFSDTLELDLGEVEPSLAGPRRPQDRIALSAARRSPARDAESYLDEAVAGSFPASDPPANGTNGGTSKAARVEARRRRCGSSSTTATS